MRVYLYSEMQKLIEKSGVGRAIYHQRNAAEKNGIELTGNINDADIVHINTVFPKSVILALRAHIRNIPVVYHAHSTREDFKNSYIGSNLFANSFGKWLKFCYSLGDVIVTPTEYSKQLLLSYGIKKRIEAVSNGIDLNYYNREKTNAENFRKKYGYSDDDKIIMSVGLTIERKGVCDFVELAKRMPQYKFIWFGETNLNTVPLNVRKAVETKLPNLCFAGYASKDDLKEAYAACDLFLFMSKEETEGIVVLEALAMKTPVLLRDIPVYSDWLKKDRDVYKADSIDEFETEIKQIIAGEKPDITENGYSVAKQREIYKIGNKLKKIYDDTINNYAAVHKLNGVKLAGNNDKL